jgi:hypothetical protein
MLFTHHRILFRLFWILMAFHVFNLSAEAPNQALVDSNEPECVIELIDDLISDETQYNTCDQEETQEHLGFNDVEYCDDFTLLCIDAMSLMLPHELKLPAIKNWADALILCLSPPPQIS